MTIYKKVISLILVFVLIFSSSFVFSAFAEDITTAYLNGNYINVRSSASTSGTKIDTLEYTTVYVLDIVETSSAKYKEWLHIKYTKNNSEKTGYIYYDKSYITLTTHSNTDNTDFEKTLKAFPESYHASLKALHKLYPNWKFTADSINLTLDQAVAMETVDRERYKQVQNTQAISWRSMGPGSYDWDSGNWVFTNDGWTGASKEAVKYYMDPRNFLNENYVYMFLQQGYDPAKHTEEGLKKIVKGTFLEKGYSDPKDTAYGGSYIKVFMAAAKETSVSPYVMAAKIIQEQGKDGSSSMISGTHAKYTGYYNFFNWGASGTNGTVVENGLAYAKDKGWDTRSKSIILGAADLGNKYIKAGQGTLYYQDFNVKKAASDPSIIWHQFAQAVHDAASKGYNLASTYSGAYDLELEFSIPVFKDMSATITPRPAESEKINNYYFNNITVSGLTPSFYRYTYNYSLRVSDNTAIKYELPQKAALACSTSFALKQGINNIVLTVKAETGHTNDYTISVNADKDCTLYITTDGKIPGGNQPSTPSQPQTPTYKLGDVNGDNNISIADMGKIKWYLIDKTKYPLNETQFKSADINKDNNISIADMGKIKWYLIDKTKYPIS